MDDFIFGTLATDALRSAHIISRRAGVTHGQVRRPRDPLPGQAVEVEMTAGPAHLCDRAWVYWTTQGEEPGGQAGAARQGTATPMELVDVTWDTLLWGYVRHFRAMLPAQPPGTLVRYRLAAGGPDGREIQADGGTAYAFYVADDELPPWTRDAVIYQIFVDRFFPGQGRAWKRPATPAGFYGGKLQGIIEKLDYIADLGANTLWLTPIFPSPSHHGYDATDTLEIEPRLGSKADFRHLLDDAHSLGMRVLLDFVPNHWSSLHPTFQAAQADPQSPYVNWYSFTRWPDEYESFFGVKELPQINLSHPAARRYLLDTAAYWLGFGVDGFRVDYAIGPTPDFWAYFRQATRTARPDCWTFGEVVEPSDSQITFQGLLDGCLDFILLEAIRQTFGFRRWEARRFADFLDRHEAFFPPDFSRPSFLDNHDMNRFLWVTGGDKRRLKTAALCQFTLSGPPVIYYGTEAGLSQERDVRQDGRGLPEESRLPMIWGDAQDRGLFNFYQQLIALRKGHACLRSGARRTLSADADVLVYEREFLGEKLGTAINLADEPRAVQLDEAWSEIALSTEAGCELQNQDGRSRLRLPALAGVVVR